MLFLAITDEELLRSAGLLLLWSEGFIEPIVPPPSPRHLAAQQLLAGCLQEGALGRSTWTEQLGGLPLASAEELVAITDDLLARGHLDADGETVFVGPEAEKQYGRRHFLELLSAFTADPQFTVLHGRSDVGTVDPIVLTRAVAGPRLVSLGGRSWQVNHVDWRRRRVYVEPTPLKAASSWPGSARPLSWALTDAMRRVLLGAEPPGVALTGRASTRLAAVREEYEAAVDSHGSVLRTWRNGQQRWWTWAGARANALLHAALEAVDPTLIDGSMRFDDRFVRLRGDATAGALHGALTIAAERFGQDLSGVCLPIEEEALRQLKFSDLLPVPMAVEVVSRRGVDVVGAARARRQRIITRSAGG